MLVISALQKNIESHGSIKVPEVGAERGGFEPPIPFWSMAL